MLELPITPESIQHTSSASSVRQEQAALFAQAFRQRVEGKHHAGNLERHISHLTPYSSIITSELRSCAFVGISLEKHFAATLTCCCIAYGRA